MKKIDDVLSQLSTDTLYSIQSSVKRWSGSSQSSDVLLADLGTYGIFRENILDPILARRLSYDQMIRQFRSDMLELYSTVGVEVSRRQAMASLIRHQTTNTVLLAREIDRRLVELNQQLNQSRVVFLARMEEQLRSPGVDELGRSESLETEIRTYFYLSERILVGFTRALMRLTKS